ncbi:MAG: molybdopterin-dependent oxidoreductase, partial [Anaerolineaceae bacterium]|nr:molybdopterin-dependent oxidoreductase [Anaerolineaceae bacterium]
RLIPKGTKVIPVSHESSGMDAFTQHSMIIKRNEDLAFIQALDAVITGVDSSKFSEKSGISLQEITEIAKLLDSSKNLVIVYGTDFEVKQKRETVQTLLKLAKKLNAKLISPKGKANSLVAEQLKLNKPFEVNGHKAAYIALGDEDPSKAIIQKLENIPFLVVQASYHSSLTAKADVVLPVTTWLEQSGYYITCDGQVQLANKSLQSPVDVKTNKEVVLAIADRLKIIVNPVWDKAVKLEKSVVEIE